MKPALSTAALVGVMVLSSLAGVACRQADEPNQPALVFVLAGQSNMYGSGRLEYLGPTDFPLPDNIELHDSSLNVSLQRDESRFGPEIGFARVLAETWPGQRFILAKHAVDGSAQFDWAPEYDAQKAILTGNTGYGPLYPAALDNIRAAVSDREARFAGLLWMQGERDSAQPDAAALYTDNMQSLIAAFRQDLGAPDLCVLIGLIDPVAPHYRWVPDVRRAQAKVAERDERVALVDTEGLLKLADNIHYSGSGQIELGRRFGQAWIEHCASSLLETPVNAGATE